MIPNLKEEVCLMVKQTKPKVPLKEDTKIKDFLDMVSKQIPNYINFTTAQPIF